MSDVESRARGIRKHIEHEKFGAIGDASGISEWSSWIGRIECVVVLPIVLPALFDASSECSRVAVCRNGARKVGGLRRRHSLSIVGLMAQSSLSLAYL